MAIHEIVVKILKDVLLTWEVLKIVGKGHIVEHLYALVSADGLNVMHGCLSLALRGYK